MPPLRDERPPELDRPPRELLLLDGREARELLDGAGREARELLDGAGREAAGRERGCGRGSGRTCGVERLTVELPTLERSSSAGRVNVDRPGRARSPMLPTMRVPLAE